MSVRFFYVDESYDKTAFCLSAIAIKHTQWQASFVAIKNHRQRLKDDFGIGLSREIHAHDLVSGHGRLGTSQLGKWQRSRIFYGLLQLVARLPEVMIFNVCLQVQGMRDPHMMAWERLVNRIERTMLAFEERELPLRAKLSASIKGKVPMQQVEQTARRLSAYSARAFLIADEGKEGQITGALRRMHVHNPIPSKYGQWATGQTTKNIVTERIIEDPFFKQSSRSYLIQLADCVAFALLKKEVAPTPNVKKYGLHKMFEGTLSGVCFKHASQNDALGVVR